MARAKTSLVVRTVAIYCRISRDIRGDALGVERQEAACRSLAEARWPGALIVLYIDNDVSAWNRSVTRPEFERMLTDAGERIFDVIVSWDLDRLGRRLTDLERCVRIAEDTGVPVVTVNGDFDLTTAGGRAYARIVMAIAEMESDHKSERLRAKFEHDRSLGRPLWRRRPFGYTQAGEVIPDEAAVLRDAASRLLGGESMTSIVMSLQHVATPWGKPFTLLSLKRNLTSPRYIGKQVSRTGSIEGDGVWEPILDEVTFHRLNDRVAGKANDRTPYLLSGFLYCAHCDLKMHAKGDVGRHRADYKCSKQPALHRHGCGITATTTYVEDTFLDRLFAVLTNKDNRTRLVADLAGDGPDEGSLLDELTELQRRKQGIVDLIADGTLAASDARIQIETLNHATDQRRGALRSLHERQENTLLSLPTDLPKLRRFWDGLTHDQRRAIIEQAIVKITVRKATRKGGAGFERARVSVDWVGGMEDHAASSAAA